MLRIDSRAVPGTRYLARTQLRMWYPLHLLYGRLWPTPPMYAWPGIPACWNALASRPPPCSFRGLRRERSFALQRILQECPYPTTRIRRAMVGSDSRPGNEALRQRYFWGPTCGPVGQLFEAQKELSWASPLYRFWLRPVATPGALVPRR